VEVDVKAKGGEHSCGLMQIGLLFAKKYFFSLFFLFQPAR